MSVASSLIALQFFRSPSRLADSQHLEEVRPARSHQLESEGCTHCPSLPKLSPAHFEIHDWSIFYLDTPLRRMGRNSALAYDRSHQKGKLDSCPKDARGRSYRRKSRSRPR